jgi:hypothetical protein
VHRLIPRTQEELLHPVFDFARREAGDVMRRPAKGGLALMPD